jgi:VCBS repeat-containing protein
MKILCKSKLLRISSIGVLAAALILLLSLIIGIQPALSYQSGGYYLNTDVQTNNPQTVTINNTMVSAGYSHTVGLKSDGTVIATGHNGYGQCNVGTWTDITQATAGGYHTVGLKSDGTVIAAGFSSFGQCNVGAWTDITQVAAGYGHTVGLTSNGTVVAVGYNGYGQCNVSTWTDIVQVTAGYQHTVALKSDGTVLAAGYNGYGQCNISTWTDIIQVAAGINHTIGLKSDGTVLAVGYNGYGQCNVGAWTDIIQVAAGYGHTVGLVTDGTVLAVGYNVNNQCDVTSWTDIAQVSAGYNHTVGLKSDITVLATGDNSYGQCNVSSWELGAGENQAPIAVADSYTTDEDTPLVVAAPGVLSNDTDADGDSLMAIKVSEPSHGAVSLNTDGSFNYIPIDNYNGTDSFTYQANDGTSDSGIITVSLTINPINDAPIDISLTNTSIDENEPIYTTVGSFSTTDPDTGNTFSYSLISVTRDIGPFIISGSDLQTSAEFDYENQNIYSILVRSTDDSELYFEKEFIITVNDVDEKQAPVIITHPVNQEVDEGATANFTAEADSTPEATVQWQVSKDGGLTWSDIDSATSMTLSFTAAASDDGNHYRAVFTNGIDQDVPTNAAMLTVNPLPPEEKVQILDDRLDTVDLPDNTKNSLEKSLDTAIKALDDTNTENDVAAINALEAFINKLEAQRGKKIPEEIADQLIAEAQGILTALIENS